MPVANMGQYIGAKVTPSFFENPLDGTNDWVQGITYEELTVVTYDSKLYISKKPVRDITVVPTDTEYWLEYPSGGGGVELIDLTSSVIANTNVKPFYKYAILLKYDDYAILLINLYFSVNANSITVLFTIPIPDGYRLPPYINDPPIPALRTIGYLPLDGTSSATGFARVSAVSYLSGTNDIEIWMSNSTANIPYGIVTSLILIKEN